VGVIEAAWKFQPERETGLKKLMKYDLKEDALNDPVPELTPLVEVLTHFWIPTKFESGF